MARFRIIIGHKLSLMRDGLVYVFRQARPDWHCELASEFDEIVSLCRESSAPLALIDPTMQGMFGPRGVRSLHALAPEMALIVLGDGQERDTVWEYIEAGARGYVSSAATPFQLQGAIDTVMSGEIAAPMLTAGSSIRTLAPPQHHQFTGRQQDVFGLLAEGCSTKTMARRLNLAVGTVKVHLAAIYRTLGVNSRLEALACGLQAAHAGSQTEHFRSSLTRLDQQEGLGSRYNSRAS